MRFGSFRGLLIVRFDGSSGHWTLVLGAKEPKFERMDDNAFRLRERFVCVS